VLLRLEGSTLGGQSIWKVEGFYAGIKQKGDGAAGGGGVVEGSLANLQLI